MHCRQNEPPDKVLESIAEASHPAFGLVLVPIWMELLDLRIKSDMPVISCLHKPIDQTKELTLSDLPSALQPTFGYVLLQRRRIGARALWLGQCGGCRKAYWMWD